MKWKAVGTTFNHTGFENARLDRWEKGIAEITHCTKHDTSFDEKDEPCWQCFDEFQITITVKGAD